ncbi:hypothetical protein PMKS-001542 [Pichia membranifaciens]|uniref:MTHFR SAM-binding regulatory domain-containing protein n=1 Tax=Pichia membranifaciens TaxID=4926 RepID=A0A1Q2YEX7_9ASCO|nr:hypothetical protein PMKS-001542 [Pichia membranifaciens]
MNLEKSTTMLLDSLHLLSNQTKQDYECENSKPWRKSLNPSRELENATEEIDSIKPDLVQLNMNGIITINSQPKINGVKSTDHVFGWGPTNGYVYQKQYLEFLLPKSKLAKLVSQITAVNEENGYDTLNYFVTDADSNKLSETNITDLSDVNAVTWGCFPGREIAQPTIVEKVSFLAWKDELYLILKKWSSVLLASSNDEESEPDEANRLRDLKSSNFIQSLIKDYVLVNIVDNNYIQPSDTIFHILKNL